MSLITKYRPTTLDTFVGNKAVIKSIKKIFSGNKNDVPHSWIFSGITGGGKTTLARIIATELGANNYGVIEINASDDRGIEVARSIVDQSKFLSMSGGKSVYILDECHQLTKDAQNALLKVLEDPPAHAYFILCTTDDQKILPTIKTRCTSFKLAPLNCDELCDILVSVKINEQLDTTIESLIQIAEASGGSPRLSLNLLEKCKDTNDVDEIASLVAGMDASLNDEGEFECSSKIVNALKENSSLQSAWKKIAGIIDMYVYQQRLNPMLVKQGLSAKLSKNLLYNGNEKIADAILVLESTGYTASKMTFISSVYKAAAAYYANKAPTNLR